VSPPAAQAPAAAPPAAQAPAAAPPAAQAPAGRRTAPVAPPVAPAAAPPAAAEAPAERRERRREDAERFAPGVAREGAPAPSIEDVRAGRRERVEGGRTIIEEPGERTIIREGGRTIIRSDESERVRRVYRDAEVRSERRGGLEVTIIRRPNGVEIVEERDADGALVRRVRREPGRGEVVIIENERRPRGRVAREVVELAPPRVSLPRERYVVEVERASEEELYEAFTAPPVERLEREYSLAEVRQSRGLRERVRRVDIDTVTFETGSWRLSENDIALLRPVAQAMARAIRENPREVFLVEGHTDAVGPDIDNLTLSDRRAETVAAILSERFDVPAENLTTQGYGEQFLKVATQAAERRNRRVTVRRITPLIERQAAR
jgi:outer membrane protein OmpA-like peptidoglycan-associated protein